MIRVTTTKESKAETKPRFYRGSKETSAATDARLPFISLPMKGGGVNLRLAYLRDAMFSPGCNCEALCILECDAM